MMWQEKSSGFAMPQQPPPDAILEAWHEVLGDALARASATWARERALIESQAAQSSAELRARIVELERTVEHRVQDRLSAIEVQVRERLTTLRDGVSIVGPVGERGERGEKGLQGP